MTVRIKIKPLVWRAARSYEHRGITTNGYESGAFDEMYRVYHETSEDGSVDRWYGLIGMGDWSGYVSEEAAYQWCIDDYEKTIRKYIEFETEEHDEN